MAITLLTGEDYDALSERVTILEGKFAELVAELRTRFNQEPKKE